MHMWQVSARQRKSHRIGAGCKQQCVVAVSAAVVEFDLLRFRVDAGDAHMEYQVDMLPRVVIGGARWRDGGGAGTSEITLRKIRAVVWCRRVRAQHRDAAGVAQLAQHFGSGVAGAASANDDDGTGYVGRGDGARRHQPFAHVSHAIALLDAPAGHRVECRSAQYLAAAQPEARMVPRATDRVADQKPVSEWGAVVCAGRADRKQLVATSCHEDRYIVDVPCLLY